MSLRCWRSTGVELVERSAVIGPVAARERAQLLAQAQAQQEAEPFDSVSAPDAAQRAGVGGALEPLQRGARAHRASSA